MIEILIDDGGRFTIFDTLLWENDSFVDDFSLSKTVVFHSYVKLTEGASYISSLKCFWLRVIIVPCPTHNSPV